MSEISKIIDGIVKSGLTPVLKKNGFKKKGRDFYRAHSDRIDVINIQASQSNHGLKAKFTINVGVYFSAISELAGEPPFTGQPKEYDCTIRERIGLITGENRDTWWEIEPESDRDLIAKDLGSKVCSVCLPWLELMSDLDSVKVGVVKNNRYIIAASISLHQGNIGEAKGYLEQSFSRQPLAKSKAKKWGKKHGILQA